MTRFLCICQCGHSRSVALTRVLHERGIPAVAIGCQTNGDAIDPLSQWADVIVVLQPQFKEYVPITQQHKVRVFDVGPDRWSNPFNQELLGILKQKVQQYFGETQ